MGPWVPCLTPSGHRALTLGAWALQRAEATSQMTSAFADSRSKRIYFTTTRFVMLFRRGNTPRHRVLISDAKLTCGQNITPFIQYNRYRCLQQRLFKCGGVHKHRRSDGEASSMSALGQNREEKGVESYPSNTPNEYEIGRRWRGNGTRTFRVHVVWPVSSLKVAFGRVAVIWGYQNYS